jgi:hypothetical protein
LQIRPILGLRPRELTRTHPAEVGPRRWERVTTVSPWRRHRDAPGQGRPAAEPMGRCPGVAKRDSNEALARAASVPTLPPGRYQAVRLRLISTTLSEKFSQETGARRDRSFPSFKLSPRWRAPNPQSTNRQGNPCGQTPVKCRTRTGRRHLGGEGTGRRRRRSSYLSAIHPRCFRAIESRSVPVRYTRRPRPDCAGRGRLAVGTYGGRGGTPNPEVPAGPPACHQQGWQARNGRAIGTTCSADAATTGWRSSGQSALARAPSDAMTLT